MEGYVKNYAQIYFHGLVEIYHEGRLNRPLITFLRSGRKGSRAALAARLALDALRTDCYLPGDHILLHGCKCQ